MEKPLRMLGATRGETMQELVANLNEFGITMHIPGGLRSPNTRMKDTIDVSVEDRFAVFNMASPDKTLPHSHIFGNLGAAVAESSQAWDFLWDFRKAGSAVYEDIVDAYAELEIALSDRTILASSANVHECRYRFGRSSKILEMREKYLPVNPFSLAEFSDDIELQSFTHDPRADWGSFTNAFAATTPNAEIIASLGYFDDETAMESADYQDYLIEFEQAVSTFWDMKIRDEEWLALTTTRAGILDRFLSGVATNSLFTELALFNHGGSIKVVPYHTHSVHEIIPGKATETVFVQPARLARRYYSSFRREIEALEDLINRPRVKEFDIENLIRSNPLFLRGLNYREAFFQVSLPTLESRSLIPDVIAKPADSEWWDVIDFKLPSHAIFVGKENRVSLSAAIAEVASQLREYSNYFDNRSAATFIEERYKLKCYKPRLVAIIGRDSSKFTAEERRRALTAFPSLNIITYDQLISAAKQHALLL